MGKSGYFPKDTTMYAIVPAARPSLPAPFLYCISASSPMDVAQELPPTASMDAQQRCAVTRKRGSSSPESPRKSRRTEQAPRATGPSRGAPTQRTKSLSPGRGPEVVKSRKSRLKAPRSIRRKQRVVPEERTQQHREARGYWIPYVGVGRLVVQLRKSRPKARGTDRGAPNRAVAHTHEPPKERQRTAQLRKGERKPAAAAEANDAAALPAPPAPPPPPAEAVVVDSDDESEGEGAGVALALHLLSEQHFHHLRTMYVEHVPQWIEAAVQRKESCLLILVGAPGAGKSTFGRHLHGHVRQCAVTTVSNDLQEGLYTLDRDGREVVYAPTATGGRFDFPLFKRLALDPAKKQFEELMQKSRDSPQVPIAALPPTNTPCCC